MKPQNSGKAKRPPTQQRALDAGDSVARFAVKQFPRFKFYLLPNRIHPSRTQVTQTVKSINFA